MTLKTYIRQWTGPVWMAALLVALAAAPAQPAEFVLHNFGAPPRGASPAAGVVLDANGNAYGTTYLGGKAGVGVVYRLDTSGHQIVLHHFTGPDGALPYAGVIRDSAGNLYGTTSQGGTANAGVVYKIDATGHQTVLYNFTGGADGGTPYAGVVGDAAGNLYGTTLFGASGGVVYKLDSSGHQTVLHSFAGGSDGLNPYAGVILDPAGNLYGSTSYGGAAGAGIVYQIDATGHETVLFSFPGGTGGSVPSAGVVRDGAGNLYGTAGGGANAAGVVYKLDPSGHETVLYAFTGGADGKYPKAGVILDSAGNLYGTTTNGGPNDAGVVYKVDTSGHETVLYGFAGDADGANPYAGVTRDTSGNLYGTTYNGGPFHAGLVYKVSAAGSKTTLYGFPAMPDGAYPLAGPVRDAAGNFYGTTSTGGPANSGTVYKIQPNGVETVLYSFTGGADGATPYAGVTLDAAGNLYGTTFAGGSANAGVVYKVDATGHETVLHSFTGGADGANPRGGVVLDPSGNLYGTTTYGGTGGFGVVYVMDPAGQEAVLYSFKGGADGFNPYAGLVRDSSGYLYGTTYSGGTSASNGVVFVVAPTGSESVIHNFTGGLDGANPDAGLILDAQGNLYGTTSAGGPQNQGIVFEIDLTGRELILYSFTGGADGGGPSGVTRDAAGNLYGATTHGGTGATGGYGVVYKLSPIKVETVLFSFTGGTTGRQPTGGVIIDKAGNIYGTTYSGGVRSTGVLFQVKP